MDRKFHLTNFGDLPVRTLVLTDSVLIHGRLSTVEVVFIWNETYCWIILILKYIMFSGKTNYNTTDDIIQIIHSAHFCRFYVTGAQIPKKKVSL